MSWKEESFQYLHNGPRLNVKSRSSPRLNVKGEIYVTPISKEHRSVLIRILPIKVT
jgi:hypothetical protein